MSPLSMAELMTYQVRAPREANARKGGYELIMIFVTVTQDHLLKLVPEVIRKTYISLGILFP